MLLLSAALGATLSVGPTGTYATPCQAIAAAAPGDVITVDAAGDYTGDACSWSTDNLTVRGINGRARIDVQGMTLSNQKGIFVIAADSATIENMELSGAAVPDQNGAGIRHQGTNLTVRGCSFHDNENGILGSPATDGTGTVYIRESEFAANGAGDGYSHNVYLGHYAQVRFEANDSRTSRSGHLFKSRALRNDVFYNLLADDGGTGSYELDLPNAGLAYIIGNVIEQSAETENSGILAYGEETSGMNPVQKLYLVNNTLLNNRGSGTFVGIGGTITEPAVLTNNLFVGGGTVCSQATAVVTTCLEAASDPGFVDIAALDLHPVEGASFVDAGSDPGADRSQSLEPTAEYVWPANEQPRVVVGTAIDIGAYEYGNTGKDPGDSGDSGASGDSGDGDSGDGDSGGGDSAAGDTAATPPKEGCGCSGAPAPESWLGLISAMAVAVRFRRPRLSSRQRWS